MSEEDLAEIYPSVCVDHDAENYHIEVELPGVKKENIDLKMGERSFCIRAPREDVIYSSCYSLAHGIDTSKTSAKFENGLLLIKAPFKSPVGGIKIEVE